MESFFVQQVCALLGTEPGLLIEEYIVELPVYKGAAWRDVCKYVEQPKRVQLDAEKGPLLEQAWMYATALRLLPYYRQQVMKVEQTTAAKTERFETDWEALADTLRAGMLEALAEIDPELDTGSGFVGFRLTFQGKEGR